MNHNRIKTDPSVLSSADNPERLDHKVGSASIWDEKITEKTFYEKVLPFDNTEVDMYEVPPARAKIRSHA